MIYREHYISKIREFYDSDLIKIITGIRRCGKSVILEQVTNGVAVRMAVLFLLSGGRASE